MAAVAQTPSSKSLPSPAAYQNPRDPPNLKPLFRSLCAQIEGGHLLNALKTCTKIDRLDPGNKDAFRTKVFLLVQTNLYSSALDFISATEESDQYAFERGYCLYRLRREEEACEFLTHIKQQHTNIDRGHFHLDAQLKYRLGNYPAAIDAYNSLLDTAEPQSEEFSDILTNVQACRNHLEFFAVDFLQSLDKLPTTISTSLETSLPPSVPFAEASAKTNSSALAITAAQTTRVPGTSRPDLTLNSERRSKEGKSPKIR